MTCAWAVAVTTRPSAGVPATITVLVKLAIPAVARYGNYLAARELDKRLEKWEGTLKGAALKTMDGVFRALPGGEKERAGRIVRDRKRVLGYAQQLRGGPWSAQIGGLSLTDPLAVDMTPSCMSCHRGHGNAQPFGLIYAKGDAVIEEDGSAGGTYSTLCQQCHVQEG